MSILQGLRLGPYEIQAPIGAGGMEEVYRARDLRLEREVAVKALPSALAGDPDGLARFLEEAKLLASLNHPRIGMIYGLEETEGGELFLILDGYSGHSDRLFRLIPITDSGHSDHSSERSDGLHSQCRFHRNRRSPDQRSPVGTTRSIPLFTS